MRKHPTKDLVRIEICSKCNLRCTMCPQSIDNDKSEKGFITSEVFNKLVDEMLPFLGTNEVHLHIGGEPLLHPAVADFVRLLSTKGLKANIVTNATLLTQTLGAELIAAGLSKIAFSFEGFTPEKYESIRRGANYRKVKQNILNFLALNPSEGEGNHVITELRYVDFPDVDASLKDALRSEFKDKVDIVKAMPYVTWMGRVGDPPNFRDQGYKYVGCYAPTNSLNVLHDGTVVACCYDVEGELPMGNVTSDSLENIQQGAALKTLSSRLANCDLKGLPCQYCDLPWTKKNGND